MATYTFLFSLASNPLSLPRPTRVNGVDRHPVEAIPGCVERHVVAPSRKGRRHDQQRASCAQCMRTRHELHVQTVSTITLLKQKTDKLSRQDKARSTEERMTPKETVDWAVKGRKRNMALFTAFQLEGTDLGKCRVKWWRPRMPSP